MFGAQKDLRMPAGKPAPAFVDPAERAVSLAKRTFAYRYTPVLGGMLRVLVDGRYIGVIRDQEHGFQFAPERGKPSQILPTADAVKQLIEGGEAV
jgi:hypothetical protein